MYKCGNVRPSLQRHFPSFSDEQVPTTRHRITVAPKVCGFWVLHFTITVQLDGEDATPSLDVDLRCNLDIMTLASLGCLITMIDSSPIAIGHRIEFRISLIIRRYARGVVFLKRTGFRVRSIIV